MNKDKGAEAINKISCLYGVSEDTVRREIQMAIDTAKTRSEVNELWSEISDMKEINSTEEIIVFLSQIIANKII